MDTLSVENQILMLYERIVCPGIYELEVPSYQQGRHYLHHFLNSFYKRPMCLTTRSENLPDAVINLAHALDVENFFLLDNYERQQKLLEFDWGDFLWIEMTSDLQNEPYMQELLALLKTFSIQNQIPIVSVVS